MRAQVSQIEKINTAVNTFRGKYGYLPGDIPDPYASQFGFIARGNFGGQGDGNGIIEGNNCNCSLQVATSGNGAGISGTLSIGETVVFWRDLSTAGLIEGGFNTAVIGEPYHNPNISGSGIDAYFPKAKLGQGNYLYTWSYNGINYIGMEAIVSYDGEYIGTNAVYPYIGMSITAQQANAIDKKVDDGLPQSGNITARFLSTAQIEWSDNTMNIMTHCAACGLFPPFNTPIDSNQAGSGACFYLDSNNIQQYALLTTGLNCALSFQFQ